MDLEQIFEQARDAFSARVVVGEPVERGGVTVIPAVSVRGGGGGFGLQARPVGAWVIRGEEVRWEPAVDASRIAIAAIALLRLGR